jgi:hypothetical protein
MTWVKPFVVEGKKIQGYLTANVMRRQQQTDKKNHESRINR